MIKKYAYLVQKLDKKFTMFADGFCWGDGWTLKEVKEYAKSERIKNLGVIANIIYLR